MFACVYFLPPLVGIYSVALASLSSLTISGVLNLIMLKKHSGLKMEFLRSFFAAMIFALASAYFTYSLYGILSSALPIFGLALSAAAGMGMYAVLTIVTDTVKLSAFKTKGVGL